MSRLSSQTHRNLGLVRSYTFRLCSRCAYDAYAGKAYQIKDIIHSQYYYPRDPGELPIVAIKPQSNVDQDGNGETCTSSRPLKEGEVGEWVLLDAVRFSKSAMKHAYRDLDTSYMRKHCCT